MHITRACFRVNGVLLAENRKENFSNKVNAAYLHVLLTYTALHVRQCNKIQIIMVYGCVISLTASSGDSCDRDMAAVVLVP